MSPQETERFKRVFNEIQKKLNLENGLNAYSNTQKGDSIDQTLKELENQLNFKFEARNTHYIKKVNRSLEKIEKGEYGLCEECGEQISAKRLQARPTASFCIECKEEFEREENNLIYEKKSHTLGKTFKTNVINFPNNEDEVHLEANHGNVLRFEPASSGQDLM